MRSFMAKPHSVEQRWFKVDASGKVLGRLATKIATILMGKNKPTYTPHVDTGDFVIVVNASRMAVTGKKLEQREYQRYTGYPGGQRRIRMKEMLRDKPEEVMRLAVRRMLPKSKLGRAMLKKLKVYRGSDHPHEAQQPVDLEIQAPGDKRNGDK